MKSIFYRGFLLVICVFVLTVNLQSQTQTDKVWTEKQSAKWFKKREWLNGLKLTPHESINKMEFARQYQKHKEWWDKAFAYLKQTDLADLKPGKYPIDGENVFATAAATKSKEFETSEWESHRKYTDIHLVITGREKIGIAPISSLTIRKPYNDAINAAFYDGEGKFYVAEPETFFICFPEDAHRPNIRVEGFDTDKKIVVKIRADK